MSETTEVVTPSALPHAAGYAELKAALPGADAAFLCSQMEANATVGQAQTAWMAEQNRRLEASKKEADEAKAAAVAKRSGGEPLGSGTGKQPAAASGDPIAAFNEAVAAKQAAGVNPRQKAVVAVIHENPELHEEYVAAVNADRPQKRR